MSNSLLFITVIWFLFIGYLALYPSLNAKPSEDET